MWDAGSVRTGRGWGKRVAWPLLLALLLPAVGGVNAQSPVDTPDPPRRPVEDNAWPDPLLQPSVETLAQPEFDEPAEAEMERLPPVPSTAIDALPEAGGEQPGLAAAPDPEPTPVVAESYARPGAAAPLPPEVEPSADPGALAFVGPRLLLPFELLGGRVEPGTRQRLHWNASQTYAGGEVRTPVDIIHGDRAGPVLCLTAAVHGDELNGVEVVRRVMNLLSPEQLAGTVVGVPVVNLFGFSRNSRYLPDRRDLNRFFPGNPRGSIASRMAHSFFNEVVHRCDALVDMHTGSFDRTNLPQVRADLRIPHVLEFTRGFGATPVLHSNGSRGMLRTAATQAGIPAVTFEVGGPGQLQPPEIEAGVQALLTLVHKLGMVRDSPEWLEPQAIFYESRWVRAHRGGMLVSDVRLGERVQRGQRIGVIVDPLENTESPIVASVSGRVIGKALNQVVLPGYAVYHLGEETSESGAVDKAASGQAVLPYEEDAARPANGLPPVEDEELPEDPEDLDVERDYG